MLVLDSGGRSRLSARRPESAAMIAVFRREGLWPPVVPSVVVAESTTGRKRDDAGINRFLETCGIVEEVPRYLARRAGNLRALARRGSAVDAIVIAIAEPGGTVLTGDIGNLEALANHTKGVHVHRV